MTMLEVLTEMISAIKFLRLITFAEFVAIV